MGRIPQSFIDELLTRVDIVDVVDSRITLKKAGREHTACCPFHNEKTPSFTVSPAKQFYHCFGCGAHGSAISFLMDYENLEFPEAVEELARSVGLEVPRDENRSAAVHKPRPDSYALLDQVDHYYRRQLREHPQAPGAVSYLKDRGLSGEIAARFGLGFAPPGWDSLSSHLGHKNELSRLAIELGLLVPRDEGGVYDRFRNRILFPIRDRRGRCVGFGGRVLGDDKPKYLNSPESPVFHKGRELYGLFEARKSNRKLEQLLVVEGYMDVVALAQFGISNAVATLGTATTEEHLERIFRTVPEVVFCFDGDQAGRRAAWRALEQTLPILRDGREARFLFLPEGEDPDSLVRRIGHEAFSKQTADSVPLSHFFFESLMQRVDTRSVDGRARLVELARPLMQKLPDSVFRDLMLEQLAQHSGLDHKLLTARIHGEPPVDPVLERGRRRDTNRRSPVRSAIRLLLEKPALATVAPYPWQFKELDLPGVALLVELLELLRSCPQLGTGAIIEHWRDQAEEQHLARLLMQPLEIPEEGIEEEFSGALQRLMEQENEQKTAILLHKDRNEGLSTEEKKELKQLLGVKHS